MIKNKKELLRILKDEKNFYYKSYCHKKSDVINRIITKDPLFCIYKYVKYLRMSEYYYNTGKKIRYAYCRLIKNKLGMKYGIEMWENNCGEGLKIYHSGSIILNRGTKIGKNCELRGANCIGNNGYGSKSPVIGDNVSFGFGACAFGDIKIANNIKIGAGAIVTKSFEEEGITIAGVPARRIK